MPEEPIDQSDAEESPPAPFHLGHYIRDHKKAVTVVVGVLLFALFIWPTLWRYDHIEHGKTLIRTHRITGTTEELTSSGWKSTEQEPTEPLPMDAVVKLKGSEATIENGYFKWNLYNGSEWTIESIDIEITVRANPFDKFDPNATNRLPSIDELPPATTKHPFKTDGEIVRQQRYDMYVWGCSPRRTHAPIIELDFKLNPGQTWTWRIVSAEGRK